MLGATLYLVGKEKDTGELIDNANSCTMCKRIIINSSIDKVIIRETNDKYRYIYVQEWIDNDDSITNSLGY